MISRRHFLGGIAATTGLTSISGCSSQSNPYYSGYQDEPNTKWWPQPEFDRVNSCYNPRPIGPQKGVDVRWELNITGPAARPVVADGFAFLPTSQAVRAVDVKTGKEQWSEDRDGEPLWPQAVLWHNRTLYTAQGGDPALLALKGTSGRRQWIFTPTGYGIYALALDPDLSLLFAGDDRGNVYALDPKTGEKLWQRQVFGVITKLAIGIRQLYVATEGGEVYALDPQDGQGYWRRKLPGMIDAIATGNGEGVFVSVFGGPIFELDPSRAGATSWQSDVWSSDSFVLAGSRLFTAGQKLVAFNTRTGKRVWSGDQTAQCGLAASGNTIYAASNNEVAAYDFNGGTGIGGLRFNAKRWSKGVEGRPEQGLVVADGAIFVLTEGSNHSSSKAYALTGP
jgi:outer membrane protein assembly factor BamB